jgi:hypothetical protein
MVSPVHGDYRRCQAETPLIDLFKFAEPALAASNSTTTPSNDNRKNALFAGFD